MAAFGLKEEPKTSIDFAAEYAAFSSQLKIEILSPDVVLAAKANLFDTLACATAGISAMGVSEMMSLIVGWGGKPEAAVWCSQHRIPAHHAAWINGMMAHARDYDDTHDGAVLHAGVSVIPAALAAADLNKEASGADLIAGIVVGLEMICRLGTSIKVGIIESGFMYTSLLGHFAATAAAARVMGLDVPQTVNALGIAYSQAAGTHQVTRDAALTKRIQPGFAAKTALISVQMSKLGIRGAQNTFEGTDGFFRTYLGYKYDPAVLRRALGRDFEFLNLSYKPYPCCRFDHTAIDAALEIHRQFGESMPDIHRVVASTNRQAYQAVCTPPEVRKQPKTIVEAQFSIPYTVAAALLNGTVGLADFNDTALKRSDVLELTRRIDTVVDEEIERDWSRNISPTKLIVETSVGTFESRVDYPRGHPKSPMSQADFGDKLDDCLAASGLVWPHNTAQDIRARIDKLETLDRAAAVLEPLVSAQ